METNLRDLYARSEATYAELYARFKQACPESSINSQFALMMVYWRGTDKIKTLQALADIHGVPLEVVAAASERSKRQYDEHRKRILQQNKML